MSAVEVTDATWDEAVLQSEVPVVVDFWAQWCGPCHVMAPVIDGLADEADADRVKVAKLDVDKNPATAASMQIMSIPTVVVFHRGAEVARGVGVLSKDSILRMVEQADHSRGG